LVVDAHELHDEIAEVVLAEDEDVIEQLTSERAVALRACWPAARASSPFATRARSVWTFRAATIDCCRSTAFSAASFR
jgi:hypothetical protein